MPHNRFVFPIAMCCAALTLVGARHATHLARAEQIAPNDNSHGAGRLANGVLTVSLEARSGEWHPEESDGPAYTIQAFAETGGPLQNPGPLLRAPVGTEIRVTMHNALSMPMWVYGLGDKRGFGDSVQVAAGQSREIRFRADTPGLFYYAARTTAHSVRGRATDDSQLGGVIAIDPPGVHASDRIFVISNWFTLDSTTVSGLGPNSMLTFNGLGWPHTPRIDMTQGDTAHWRFVNLSILDHPLHLHGSFFRVDAKGGDDSDTTYAPGDRRMAVTELMPPGSTMSMSWAPVHGGNWILHCHISSHTTRSEYFEMDRRRPTQLDTGTMMHDVNHLNHMAGLVLGIRVKPRGAQAVEQPVSQRIRLLVRSRPNVYGQYYGYGFVRGDAPEAAMPDSFSVPGPTLELVRGKRVEITVVNQSKDAAAIHWHGIELESLADGVPGWSGSGSTTMPFILPGDSLVVRFTPPRAGTFMYHSHSNEMQQISSGLYGAIVVRDPAVHSNVDERLLMFSDDGPTVSFFTSDPPILLNGKVDPDTIDVRAGQPTRLRMMNIRNESLTEMSLEQDGVPVMWRTVAKDGAELPASQQRERPARMVSSPGETYDMVIAPQKPGTMMLRYLAQPSDTTWQHAVIRAR